MYSEDSFFTLSVPGQLGLFFLSCLVGALIVYLAWRLTGGRHWSIRIAIAVIVFFLFEWLSPQIYYTYYIYLLGVPWQLVIQTPPTPLDLANLMTFTGAGNLSQHSRGLLGWIISILALLNRRPKPFSP